MTKAEIKGDLINIRMYYLDYDFFKNWEKRGVGSAVKATVDKYNRLMANAPLNLFRVYLGVYCQGQTQAEIADDLGYSEHQIYIWHNQLFQYLQNEMG